MQFLDTRSPDIVNQTENYYTGNGDQTKMGDLFIGTGNVAVTIPGSNFVALGPDYFADQTQTEQIAIAIHEALHIMFPTLGDTGLAITLEQFGFKPSVDPTSQSFNSQEITDWIVGSANHSDTTSGGCKNPGGK